MRKPQPSILYLYEVREVDVDEHLGEVAVLEERDVGGAADRGVELLRERGLGIARAGAEGDVAVDENHRRWTSIVI